MPDAGCPKLDHDVVEPGRIGARNQHHDTMEPVALFHVFGMVERDEKPANVGVAAVEVLAPAEVDQEQVHVCRREHVARQVRRPNGDYLELLSPGGQHRVPPRGEAGRQRGRRHVVDQRVERMRT